MSNSAEWSSLAISPGLSPLGPTTIPVRFSKWLGGVSEFLGAVLEILGVIKKFAVLLEDPLTAVILELEKKIKAYLQDKGGVYLSYDLNRLIKAYENRPKPVYRGNPTLAEKANLELQSFYTFLSQFKGIDSFNREYYNRLTNTNINPRPIAYNSTVFALFLAFGANVDTIKPLISFLIFIDQFINGRSMQPSVDGFRYGFTLKPNPLDMFDFNNTVVSYQDVVKGSREVQQLSVTVDLNSLTAIFENSQLVFYTNPEGFVRFRSDTEKDSKSEISESRIIYHFADATDAEHLVYDEEGKLKKLSGIESFKLEESFIDEYTIPEEKIKNTAYLVVDFNDFITVNETIIDKSVFYKLKYPLIDATGLKLIDNPDPGTIYARVYFTKSKTYSAPLKIKLPTPIDFDDCMKDILFCLLYYRQRVLKADNPDQSLKAKLNGRIPEDIFTTVESYCGYLESFDDKLDYDKIKNDYNFVSICLALSDYPYLSRVFNFSTLDITAKKALEEKLKLVYMTDHTLKYDPYTPDINAEVVAFLDSILIAKYAVPDQQEDPNAIWKKTPLYNIDTLKVLMDKFFRFLKEFAETLKGAGQGLVKAITNLEKWVKFLKSIVDLVNMVIKLIIQFVESLSGAFSVNALFYPNAQGEMASSVQDLANKLLSSTIPPSEDNPNPENQYYLGAALVWPTGVPNFLMDILSSLITSWNQSGDTGDSGEEEVEL